MKKWKRRGQLQGRWKSRQINTAPWSAVDSPTMFFKTLLSSLAVPDQVRSILAS
jgi:hypothetical protein